MFQYLTVRYFSVSNAMKTAPAPSNVNIEMQRYYAGQNYREAAGAAPAPGPGWPGAAPYEANHPGNNRILPHNHPGNNRILPHNHSINTHFTKLQTICRFSIHCAAILLGLILYYKHFLGVFF